MDHFLRQRGSDPRFALRAPRPEVALARGGTTEWYAASNLPAGVTRADMLRISKHTASALKRTRHQAATTDAKKSSASSSGSESEGGTKKKKKSKKGNAPGYDGPNKCWDGYKKVEGKMRGERGSCEKA